MNAAARPTGRPPINHMATVQDPTKTLQTFALGDLAQFTRAGSFAPNDSTDFRVFYVGKDDVHDILKYLISRCSISLAMNMFGYDDDELDAVIESLVADPNVYVQGTLDKSQASGVHEKAILAKWTPAMRASFAIGESATHQITHTKGGVIDGVVGWEGSTNWSASGEGTLPSKAQNNTLAVFTNPVQIEQFRTELNQEHAVVLQQEKAP